MSHDDLKKYTLRLPDSPGVYRFYNDESKLIYVGKAKSLKKRVTSYFTKSNGLSRKTTKLVSEISKIEYTLSNTEFDALLLENNLIKQNQPKYNILLKDDKTFPYLCILNERFPRIISTRKYIPKQGEYFGPYASVVAMKSVLELIRKLYTIRTCSLLLSESNINQKKFKVCLEFHIGNCKGPCEGLQPEEEYLTDIEQARHILKGNLSAVEKHFQFHMKHAADSLSFEKAQFFKDKLQVLERFQSKSLVVNRALTDIDVISISSKDEYAYVNYMLIKEGAIIYSKTIEIKKQLEEPDDELLALTLLDLRAKTNSTNATVLSNLPVPLMSAGLENIIPKIGDKKKLVSLSLKNALEMQKERALLRAEKRSRNNEVIEILQKDLHLQHLPRIIECFDNSNFQGDQPVASMVRFVNGKVDKKNYRHYNIKTVTGPNDFESMKEIVGRRYKRITEEAGEFPDLILVDGGKGQLSSACEALKALNLYGKIPIAGIAKRLEEIYFPEDPIPLHVNKKSPGLLLLQQIRDEAHRFAITFHRQKRSKVRLTTELDDLKGIGEKTVTKLLQHFKSVKKIKEASQAEVEKIIGREKAAKLFANKKP
ncbi:MAG TPA: excinuclease ABC subunit UvrC [Cyclobacteriaceae bacterium]|nr:excinuclease ABC subunit UvrC [Cyclobacteriaceae bacterium]HRJ80319.1 excinuclease ABC subunit UvrC [Cyclobacteriaceae bacterium]